VRGTIADRTGRFQPTRCFTARYGKTQAEVSPRRSFCTAAKFDYRGKVIGLPRRQKRRKIWGVRATGVYGRGNNAYRWAGETDGFEAVAAFAGGFGPPRRTATYFVGKGTVGGGARCSARPSRGGLPALAIGLHTRNGSACRPRRRVHTTHGLHGNLPKELPDYQEKAAHLRRHRLRGKRVQRPGSRLTRPRRMHRRRAATTSRTR